MSDRRFWPWLVGVALVHLLALAWAVPRPAPRPEVTVRVVTAVSFPSSSSAAPVAAPAQNSRQESVSDAKTATTQETAPPSSPASETGDGGVGSGTVAGSQTGEPDVVGMYLERLRQTVADHRNYPYAARTRRQQGTVLLAFRLDDRGGLAGDPHVLRSSGYPRLDAAAVEAVKVASPFVPPPESARPWEFRLPVEFVAR